MAEESKPRKKLGRKMIALILIAVMVVAIGIFLLCFIGSDMQYNMQIKSDYKQLMKNLDEYMLASSRGYASFDNREIISVRFGDLSNVNVSIEIISSGDYTLTNGSKEKTYLDSLFNVPQKYYNAVLEAQDKNDIKGYLSALDVCFQNMEFESIETSTCSPNLEISKENAEKFNELFNLSTVQTDKNLNSVAFLPQFIDYVVNGYEEKDDLGQIKYVMKGLSFVEVEGESGDGILPGKKSIAIVNFGSNKNKVKVYEIDFEFTIIWDAKKYRFDSGRSYIFAIQDVLAGLKGYAITNVQVKKIQQATCGPLIRMQLDVFDFKKSK